MTTIDRIENGIAVLINESGERKEYSVTDLPDGIREGSVLREVGEGFVLDDALTKSRRNDLASRARKLFKKR